jgi:hypothetical protein
MVLFNILLPCINTAGLPEAGTLLNVIPALPPEMVLFLMVLLSQLLAPAVVDTSLLPFITTPSLLVGVNVLVGRTIWQF